MNRLEGFGRNMAKQTKKYKAMAAKQVPNAVPLTQAVESMVEQRKKKRQ